MLSDEEIASAECSHLSAHAQFVGAGEVWIEGVSNFARAIESAACAERDARIAELEAANEAFGKRQEWWNTRMLELEQQLAEARKDAMHEAALICDALPAPPSCNVLERNLWDVATVAAADAIRAAIKEQT